MQVVTGDLCPALETVQHITLRCPISNWDWTQLNLMVMENKSTSIIQFVEEGKAPSETTLGMSAWTLEG
jgi:hypothetical protein